MRVRPLLLLLASLAAAPAGAQVVDTTAGAATPEALAARVMRTFERGTPAEFAAMFPDSAGRVFMRSGAPKRSDIARVVLREPRRAVLLLAGTTRGGGGGNQTNAARHFSGFYEALEAGGTWTVARKIPFDSGNHIRTQSLVVDVAPGKGITVVDTLTLAVGAPHGFGFRINADVKLSSVVLDGAPVEHDFGGGVVWLRAPRRASSRLVLAYTLATPADSATRGAPSFGALHNTDIWHPAFDYISANHLAQISARVTIPAEYHLTTTLPQTDSVRAGVRTVHARSLHHAFLLALIFDREWRPRTTDFGTFRFETFTRPGFRHSHDTLAARTRHVYDLLTPRFGEPQYPSRYLAAVESRGLGAGGFNVRMNNAAVSGAGGGSLGSVNGQVFAHETGHAWTMNASGLGSNFLHEAWAKYVEAVVLRDLYGPAAERDYWNAQWTSYMVGNDRSGWRGGFEGRQSILGDFDNGRIHYMKGSWILRAGEWVMGTTAFDRGMRAYVDGMGRTPGGYEELVAAWSKAAGRNMAPVVMPWLTSKHVPDVEARVEGRRLIVTQEQRGENFELPKLEVELTTPTGTTLRTIHLRHRADTVDVGPVGHVTRVRVDPNHRFLMRRHWGEAVRFELPATALPGAEPPHLWATFLRQGVTLPATRRGDVWVVEVPLAEGSYQWIWTAGGAPREVPTNPALTGTRTVRPMVRVQEPYPGR